MLARGPRTEPHTCSGPRTGPSMLAQGVLRACSGRAQACSGSAQACSPSAQVKAAAAQVGGRSWNWGKKSYVRLLGYLGVFGHKIFSRGPSMRLVSIAALAQALIGLGTGRSPSSSSCSPSAQALLSRAQSRSSTLSSEPIMHF